jgi:hypothetical protein
MQKKRTRKRKFNPVFLFVPAAIILCSVVILTTVLAKDSELVLLVAPSTATVKLDGRKIKSGTIKIRSGSHKLEFSGDELETKTIDFDIAKNETKSINCYATGAGGNFDYYLGHEEEIERLALVGDDEAKVFVDYYNRTKSILDLLPIVVSEDHGSKTATLSKGEDCERSYCLKLVNDNADLGSKMEKKLAELGYSLGDYEVKIERTNSIEEEEDED